MLSVFFRTGNTYGRNRRTGEDSKAAKLNAYRQQQLALKFILVNSGPHLGRLSWAASRFGPG